MALGYLPGICPLFSWIDPRGVEKYPCGIIYRRSELGNFFIASPEKALCDVLYFSSVQKREEVFDYLLDELRIDREQLKRLDLFLLSRLADVYKRKNRRYLLEEVSSIQQEKEEKTHLPQWSGKGERFL